MGMSMSDPLVEFLRVRGALEREHSQSELLSHLIGTQRILEKWQLRDAVCHAGLFHSSYGTPGFDGLIPLMEREKVRERIGDEAETLVYAFCAMGKMTFLRNLERQERYYFHNRFTGTWEFISELQVIDLCHLSAANLLEQLPRVPADLTEFLGGDLLRLQKRLGSAARVHIAEVFACLSIPVRQMNGSV